MPKVLPVEPFKTLVVLGESTVEGGPWLLAGEPRWADVLAGLINTGQEQPVRYVNAGIGASVIWPARPGYDASIKSSALERHETSVIDNRPDLFVLAYGLNDMRAGMAVELFAREMRTIVRQVMAACSPVTASSLPSPATPARSPARPGAGSSALGSPNGTSTSPRIRRANGLPKIAHHPSEVPAQGAGRGKAGHSDLSVLT